MRNIGRRDDGWRVCSATAEEVVVGRVKSVGFGRKGEVGRVRIVEGID